MGSVVSFRASPASRDASVGGLCSCGFVGYLCQGLRFLSGVALRQVSVGVFRLSPHFAFTP